LKKETNPLEDLFCLASQQNWCWNLSCTTCGHLHFKYAFQDIGDGIYPDSSKWIISIQKTDYRKEKGKIPNKLSPLQINELIKLGLELNLVDINSKCRFPDWLGHLGLLINYTNSSNRFLDLSNYLKSSFSSLQPHNLELQTLINSIKDSIFSIKNLEQLEQLLK